jgi:hypothetical protein
MFHEKIVLEQLLKIPVSDVAYRDGEAVVYSNEKNIGNLPVSKHGDELQYTLTETFLNALDWPLVYSDNKELIHNIVILKFDNAISNDHIKPGTFRKLIITQDDHSVRMIECIYEQGEWRTVLLDY